MAAASGPVGSSVASSDGLRQRADGRRQAAVFGDHGGLLSKPSRVPVRQRSTDGGDGAAAAPVRNSPVSAALREKRKDEGVR
jgi:hypothetical protein